MSIQKIEKEIKKWGFEIEYCKDIINGGGGVVISSGSKISKDIYEFKCVDNEDLDEWSCYVKKPNDSKFKMIFPEEVPYNLEEAQNACVIWFYNKY